MTLKSLFVVPVLVVGLSLVSFAEGGPDGPSHKMMDAHLEKMTKELSLSPEQAQKVKAIIEDAGHQIDKKKLMEELKALREKKDSEIEAVLTDQQRQKFKGFKEKQKKDAPKHLKEMMLHRLTEKLKLSDTQVKELSGILDRTHQEMDVATKGKFWEASRETIAPILKNQDEAIEKILTPEQLTQFKTLKEERKDKKWKQK